MSKGLALPNFFGAFSQTQTKKQTYNSSAHPFRFWLSVFLIGLNAALLVSYLSQVNRQSLQGYQIKTLQTRLAQLNAQNRAANLKVSEATSIVSIQTDFLNSNFVSAGTPQYLHANTNQFSER